VIDYISALVKRVAKLRKQADDAKAAAAARKQVSA